MAAAGHKERFFPQSKSFYQKGYFIKMATSSPSASHPLDKDTISSSHRNRVSLTRFFSPSQCLA